MENWQLKHKGQTLVRTLTTTFKSTWLATLFLTTVEPPLMESFWQTTTVQVISSLKLYINFTTQSWHLVEIASPMWTNPLKLKLREPFCSMYCLLCQIVSLFFKIIWFTKILFPASSCLLLQHNLANCSRMYDDDNTMHSTSLSTSCRWTPPLVPSRCPCKGFSKFRSKLINIGSLWMNLNIALMCIIYSHRCEGFFSRSPDRIFLAFVVIREGNLTSSCNINKSPLSCSRHVLYED